MKSKIIYLLLILQLLAPSIAKHAFFEKEYQAKWCSQHNGIQEYILKDKTRVDCLLADYAIEFDFAEKWHSAIGQALYYSIQTNKQPGIVLILEDKTDISYLKRLKIVANKFNIKIWILNQEYLKKENKAIKPCLIEWTG